MSNTPVKALKSYVIYNSELANRLFPEEDFFEDRARQAFDEAWRNYEKDIDDLNDFIIFLETFTPKVVQDSIDSADPFTQTTINQWQFFDRPLIVRKLRNLFKES